MAFTRSLFIGAALVIISAVACAQQFPAQTTDQNVFIYLGDDDLSLHLVWEEHPVYPMQWYVIEKSYDGSNFFSVDSVQPVNLFDIHANNYPDNINLYNTILYTTETGSGRFIYNDVRDEAEAGERNFWYRVKMVKTDGGKIYTKSVLKSVQFGIADIDRLREIGGQMPDEGTGSGKKKGGNQNGWIVLKRGSGPCPNIQAPPTGYIFNGNVRTMYGECCYWEEREYTASQITEACGGMQAWCCPRDCSPVAYDPCCLHTCSEYNQCSCHPWTCCDVANASVWVVTSSTTYTMTAAIDSLENVSCNGLSDGNAILNVANGLPPYTYNYDWNNGQGSGAFLNALAAGTYSVTVTDFNECTVSTNFVITQPPPLTSSLTPTQITCFGYNNGSIDLSVNGGTPNYTYNWTNNTGTQDQNSLSPGNYAVTATDANGCQTLGNIDILEPAEFTGVVSITNIACYGWSTGTALLNMTGGTYPYTYVWSTGDTTVSIGGFFPGIYFVTATDVNGCSFTASGIITQATEINVSITPTNANCGFCDGSAIANATGGSGSYSYDWATVPTQNTQTGIGLCAGITYLNVTDANVPGCAQSYPVSISSNGAQQIAVSSVNASCPTVCNGTATVTFSGGCTSPPCDVVWFDGNGTDINQPNQTANNLCPGNYAVRVTNGQGCIATENVLVSAPADITVTVNVTNQSCAGVCNGGASVDPPVGGTAPYTYQWQDANGAPIPLQTNPSIANLCPGDYFVRVLDFAGCTVTQAFTILPYNFSISTTKTDLLCNGVCDASATVNITGGTGPFTFQWLDANSAAITGETSQSIFNLCAGTYYIQVTSTTNCVLTSPAVIISEPAAITATTSKTDIPCAGQCTGTGSVTAGGGTPPYTYQWYHAGNVALNGETNANISNLCEGTYFVIVTDANGCASAPQQVDILVLTNITTSIAKTDITCFDANDGTITLTVNGATAPITFSWNNGLYTSQNLSALPQGFYTVIVTDASGCTATNSAAIVNPLPITATATPYQYPGGHVSCTDYENGRATVVVSGGTAPFVYLWSDSQQAAMAIGLPLGTYSATVTDAEGCTATTDVTLNINPLPLLTNLVPTNISCFGGSDGAIDLTVTNGIGPFVYEWLPMHIVFIEDLDSLSAGTYTVYVTDTVNGCSVIDSITLTQPTEIIASFQTVDVSCFGGNDGAIGLTVNGGTPGYLFLWNGGPANSQNLNGISAGIYVVEVTDANGCVIEDSVQINEPTTIPVGNNSIETCRDSFFIGGAYQTVSGIYYDTVQYGAGCDSVVATDLQFVNGFLVPDTVSICNGSSYFVGGALQTTAGIYYDTLVAAGNCDSVIETHLLLVANYFTRIDASICDDEFYFAAGANQNTTGVYVDSFIAAGGCDSIVETHLTVFPTNAPSRVVTICAGESFFAGGAFQNTTGFYYDTFATAHGCDSTLETQLIVQSVAFVTRAVQICDGDSILAGGSYQTTDGIYYDSLNTAGGCDSVIETTLTVVANFFTPVTETICEGQRFFVGGADQTAAGVYHDTIFSAGGCDSIIQTTLSVVDVEISVQPDSATVQQGNAVSITVIGGTGNLLYSWSSTQGLICDDSECGNVTVTALDDISYTVIATDSFGCADTSVVLIYVLSDTLNPDSEVPLFYVPNAFTPNDDGINDQFRVMVNRYTSYRLLVFDRWGTKLFEATNPAIGWDGIFRGKNLNPGVYIYYVDVTFVNNVTPPDYLKYKKGSVTLIR